MSLISDVRRCTAFSGGGVCVDRQGGGRQQQPAVGKPHAVLMNHPLRLHQVDHRTSARAERAAGVVFPPQTSALLFKITPNF